MDEKGFAWIGIIVLIILAAIIIMDIAMFVSLMRQGDERRQLIVGKASMWSFIAIVGCFAFNFAENTIRGRYEGMNPFVMLAVAAILYFVFLMYYKRKYGG